MADVTVQSSFPGTVGTAVQSDDARRVNAVLPFTFTAWKDAIDARLVNRSYLISGTLQQASNKAIAVKPSQELDLAPRQGRNKAYAARLNQELGEIVATKRTITTGFSHPDIFAATPELSLVGHIFP